MITEIRTVVDATTKQARPDTNYGELTWLTLASGADTRMAFIYGDPSFDVGDTVSQAILYVTTKNAWTSGDHTITARRISEPWVETGDGSITYNDQPAVAGATVTANVGSPAAGAILSIDVTSLFAEAAAGSAFYGIRLSVDTSSYKQLHSAEAEESDYHPYFVITHTTAPDPPTGLSPGGSRVVSLAQPTFGWDFSDADGDNQGHYKFQLDNNSDFSSTLVDTGWVASSESQKVLSEVSLSEATTYYWRVAVKDSSGVESGWSDVASFTRDTKGTLTITNPSSGTPVVEETTPPINHTFSGETQAASQHLLYQRESSTDPWELIHDSGRQTTTSLTYTLPEDLITSEDYDYKVTVRVWDTEARETTPGDPEYVEASREFTYDDDGTPDPITSVVATTDDTPALTVTWTDASAPDYYAIRYWRSGVSKKWAYTRLVPSDVFVSGTTYSKKLWELDPAYTWTVEVQRVVLDGGVYTHSTGNDTDSATPQPKDAWLVVPERNVYLPIYSPDPQDYVYGSQAETFFPLGAQRPTRLTMALRGAEGTISGEFGKPGSGAFGTSGKTLRATLENITVWAARGEKVRLVHGDRSFPIVLGEVTCTPLPNTQNHQYAVTIEFWQAGEYPRVVR